MDKNKIYKGLLPVVNHTSWDRVEDYLSFERERLIAGLLKSSDIKTINKLQGQIEFLDQVLNLPHTTKQYM
jgi:hypothetical protein